MALIITALPLSSCSGSTAATSSSSASKVTLNVSAAASLTDAINAIDALYTQKNPNVTITPNFASSGTLQKQIEAGAPADVFLSAAPQQMDALQKEQLIIDSTRKDILGNEVVLIVPKDSTLNLTDFKQLLDANVKKIAIGDPTSVPAGTYAKKVFEELGIWTQLQPKFVLGSDVRQVLAYVAGDNVDAGVVYATDAPISKGVKIVAVGPADINNTIIYPAAVLKGSKNQAAAKAYVDFLSTPDAKAIFEKYGFVTK